MGSAARTRCIPDASRWRNALSASSVKSTTTGNDHRRHAILEQIDPPGELLVSAANLVEEIRKSPAHAVALCLSRDEERVVGKKLLEESVVPGCDRLSFLIFQDLRPKGRVVLGKRARAFELERGLTLARDGMEEDRFLHCRDQRMADAAQDRVVRPDHESKLAVAAQKPAIMKEVPVEESRVAASQGPRGFRIHAEPGPPRRLRARSRSWEREGDRSRRGGTRGGRSETRCGYRESRGSG